MELDIRRTGIRIGIPEATRLEEAGGDRSLFLEEILQAR